MGNTALKFNAKILMVIFAMFLGLCIASAIAVVTARVPGAGSKGMVLVVQVLQNGIAFFLPAVLCAWLFTRRPWHDLRYDVAPTWTAVAVVVAMYVVSIPAMNYLVDWNAHISFPAGMSGVEHTLRHYEDVAQQATTGLLKDKLRLIDLDDLHRIHKVMRIRACIRALEINHIARLLPGMELSKTHIDGNKNWRTDMANNQ